MSPEPSSTADSKNSRRLFYPGSEAPSPLSPPRRKTDCALFTLPPNRSTSITEDMMSNNNLTEDDLSSDAHTTDVSRTSSYLATGSSFEESLAQSQAASGRFLGSAAAALAGTAPNPPPAGGSLSSLAERLARAEETVGREHEKGLLYRQVPRCVVLLFW